MAGFIPPRVSYMGGAVSRFGDIHQALGFRWTAEGRDFSFVQYSQTPANRYVSDLQITLSYQRPFEDLDRIMAADRATVNA